jgi:ATP-dependent helicase HrpB
MSATLDAEAVAGYLGGARAFHAEGRVFDVDVEYRPPARDTYLDRQVASACRAVLADGPEGDLLVFLPGVAEIRRAADALRDLAEAEDLIIVQLYGDLSKEEQDQAVRPARRRKIILSTNIAESSVTIDGVRIVIDSGLARVASYSAWSGLPALHTRPVSRAACIQRAGRAGRQASGLCVRLYTRESFETRPPYEVPEIRRADLSQTLLELRALGVEHPGELPWFDPPPAVAVEGGLALLKRLGALENDDKLTSLGRRMAVMPAHPRLARLVLEGEKRGAGREACALAALIGEGEISGHDVVTAWERTTLTGSAARARDQLLRHLENTGAKGDVDAALHRALLAAFPDRVMRRRDLPATIACPSEYFVAIDVEERKTATQKTASLVVRAFSPIEPDWLLDLEPSGVEEKLTIRWNAERERVEAVSALVYDKLTLSESAAPPSPEVSAAMAKVLADEAVRAGPARFCDAEALEKLVARIGFLKTYLPGEPIPALGRDTLERVIRESCLDCVSFKDLKEADLLGRVRGLLPPEQQQKLERFAPEFVQLMGGRRVRVHYEEGKPPWIESRLQDFFGMRTGPTVAGGRVPLTLHLLAPNQRAVQVTSDLAGFWERVYPQLRRELGRRYPRHKWPEDPLV